jgi:hypothetical protein
MDASEGRVYQRQLTLKQYLAAEHIGVDVVEGSQHIPEKRLAAHGHRRRTVILVTIRAAAWGLFQLSRLFGTRPSNSRQAVDEGREQRRALRTSR